MKYAILSDIHSNIQALEAALKLCKENKVEKIICLGDVVGYNANPCECVKIAKDQFEISLQGNHDQKATEDMNFNHWSRDAVAGMKYTMSKLNDDDKAWLGSLDFLRTVKDKTLPFFIGHGIPFPHSYYSFFDYIHGSSEAFTFIDALKKGMQSINLAFYGHTHIPAIVRGYKDDPDSRLNDWDFGSYILDESCGLNEIDLNHVKEGNEFLIINPGSVGQPRSEGKPSFVILDTTEGYLQIVPFDYDFKAAQDAIIDASYCDRLAQRLDYTEKFKL